MSELGPTLYFCHIHAREWIEFEGAKYGAPCPDSCKETAKPTIYVRATEKTEKTSAS